MSLAGCFLKLGNIDSSGMQSIVDLGILDGLLVIRKRIGNGMSHAILNFLIDQLVRYRTNVGAAGFRIPRNLNINLIQDEKCSYLEIMDEYLGEISLDKLMSNCNLYEYSLLDIWGDLIECLIVNYNLLEHQYKTRVMIDAKPENFIFKEHLFYIDFFPPILSDLNGNMSFFNKSVYKREWKLLLEFKFGDIRGQITRLLFLVRRCSDDDTYNRLLRKTLMLIDGRILDDAREYICCQSKLDFLHLRLFQFGENKKISEILNRLVCC